MSSKPRLTRSRTDRKIAGVAGGIAEYLDLDPTLVRVIWVLVIILPGGIGLIPYIILWVALPEDNAISPTARPAIAVAEERYARGEISADELKTIKDDLSR